MTGTVIRDKWSLLKGTDGRWAIMWEDHCGLHTIAVSDDEAVAKSIVDDHNARLPRPASDAAKHTPEPWEVHAHGEETCIDGIPPLSIRRTPEERLANKKRRMRCVNALAGVPDPEGWVKGRNALLDVAKRLRDYDLAPSAQTHCSWRTMIDKCRSAIAACEEPGA